MDPLTLLSMGQGILEDIGKEKEQRASLRLQRERARLSNEALRQRSGQLAKQEQIRRGQQAAALGAAGVVGGLTAESLAIFQARERALEQESILRGIDRKTAKLRTKKFKNPLGFLPIGKIAGMFK